MLKELYGEDGLEKIDLLIGSLAEGYRPDGFVFGDTQFQIFLLMASRRIIADRFFTDSFTKEVCIYQEAFFVSSFSGLTSALLSFVPCSITPKKESTGWRTPICAQSSGASSRNLNHISIKLITPSRFGRFREVGAIWVDEQLVLAGHPGADSI